jgi:hypothetical protein
MPYWGRGSECICYGLGGPYAIRGLLFPCMRTARYAPPFAPRDRPPLFARAYLNAWFCVFSVFSHDTFRCLFGVLLFVLPPTRALRHP